MTSLIVKFLIQYLHLEAKTKMKKTDTITVSGTTKTVKEIEEESIRLCKSVVYDENTKKIILTFDSTEYKSTIEDLEKLPDYLYRFAEIVYVM